LRSFSRRRAEGARATCCNDSESETMTILKLLFVTSELAPFSSTGGLAYVSQSFPKHLRERGVDARIIVPRFGKALEAFAGQLRTVDRFTVPVAGVERACAIELLEHAGNLIYFVRNDHYFARDSLYNHPDEAERFLFFNRAILQFCARGQFVPDIFNGNDWLSCLLPFLLRTSYADDPVLAASKVLLSIRNLRYQGVFHKDVCQLLGVEWSFLCAAGLDFYEYVNLLKLGIVYADMIVTSSPSYAREIQVSGYDPLTETLRRRQGVLCGVVEGIDVQVDDPATDPRLHRNYGAADAAEGKRVNKAFLQHKLGLPVRPEAPMIGWINRLTSQKGVDLIRLALGNGLLDEDIQIVACADGEPIFEEFFRRLCAEHPSRFFYANYDEALAYQIYAASDMYLMPSSYEPGGISQLISMRYGAVPIVRETGGLADTVVPFDPASGEGTGFSFDFKSTWIMMHTIRRAIAAYNDGRQWPRIVQNCMRKDSSWKAPIDDYMALFDTLRGVGCG
jgi:starch synthase